MEKRVGRRAGEPTKWTEYYVEFGRRASYTGPGRLSTTENFEGKRENFIIFNLLIDFTPLKKYKNISGVKSISKLNIKFSLICFSQFSSAVCRLHMIFTWSVLRLL